MSLESTTVDVDGYTYRITELGAKQSRKVLMKLIQIFGPALTSLLESVGDKGVEGLMSMKGAELADVASSLLPFLTDENYTFLTSTFGASSFYMPGDERSIQMRDEFLEMHFKGAQQLRCMKWLAACINYNYSDFLGAWGTIAKSANAERKQPMEKASSLSPSPAA